MSCKRNSNTHPKKNSSADEHCGNPCCNSATRPGNSTPTSYGFLSFNNSNANDLHNEAHPHTNTMPVGAQERGRPRRQFHILSTPDTFEVQAAASRVRLVVPNRFNSDLSMVSSDLNPSKSSMGSQQYGYVSDRQHVAFVQTPSQSQTNACEEQMAEPAHISAPCSGICRFQMHDLNYLRQRLQKCCDDIKENGGEVQMHSRMNKIFLERLCDIECKADGDVATKLITYQEWVDMLLQINDNIIENLGDMECEVNEQLDLSAQREYKALADCENYRNDICLLIKLLRNAYQNNNWDTHGMEFQTINPADILGNCTRRSESPSCANTDDLRQDSQSRYTSEALNLKNSVEVRNDRHLRQQNPSKRKESFLSRMCSWKSSCSGRDSSYSLQQEENFINQEDTELSKQLSCESTCCNMPPRNIACGVVNQEHTSCLQEQPKSCENTYMVLTPKKPNCLQIEPPHHCTKCCSRENEEPVENEDTLYGGCCPFSDFSGQNTYMPLTPKETICEQKEPPQHCTKCCSQKNEEPVQNEETLYGGCCPFSDMSDQNEISDRCSDKPSCATKQTNILQGCDANLRALAIEVAAKHDENCKMKRQMTCLEEEVQKAQQKITLKDNVIKDLRNDLKCAKSKLADCKCEASRSSVTPINLATCSASSPAPEKITCCRQMSTFRDSQCPQLDSSTNCGQVEQNKLKCLEAELDELFLQAKDFNEENMEFHRKRLVLILAKSEDEKLKAYDKLDFIRRLLRNLEASGGESCSNDLNSGCCSKWDTDPDIRTIYGVRKRLQMFNESNVELKKKLNQMELDNNVLSTQLVTQKTIDNRSSETLKEIACLITDMTGKLFSYDEIYCIKADKSTNPFCQFIMQMDETNRALRCEIDKKQKEIEALKQNILCKERDLGKMQNNTQQNEDLRCELEHLRCSLVEKEQTIAKLNGVVDQLRREQQDQQHGKDCCLQSKERELREVQQKLEYANHRAEALMRDLSLCQRQERFFMCENRKLNDELKESKRIHSDLCAQMNRLNTVLKTQDSNRNDISKKYEELERSYQNQEKQLRIACNQMNCLKEKLMFMDKKQDEHNMERNLLCEEVFALKEKEADLLGKQQCLTDKLMQKEKELFQAHEVLREQQSVVQRSDSTQKECVKRLQEEICELKQQYMKLVQDYKKLEDEYKQECDVNKQNERVLESFRNWKEAQLKADEATRKTFRQYEEHIKTLLENKQTYLDQYRQLQAEYCALQQELERIKRPYSCNNPGLDSNASDNSIQNRIESIRRVSFRVSQQGNSLRSRSEEPNCGRGSP